MLVARRKVALRVTPTAKGSASIRSVRMGPTSSLSNRMAAGRPPRQMERSTTSHPGGCNGFSDMEIHVASLTTVRTEC